MLDPFATLGLHPESVTLDEARRQYRSLLRTHHPDKIGGDTSKAQAITQAWGLINTPEKLSLLRSAILARRSRPSAKRHLDAHSHDVRTADGIIHFGPFTRGAILREATILARERWTQGAITRLKHIASGRLALAFSRSTRTKPLLAHAISVTGERVYLYLPRPGSEGKTIIAAPMLARGADGIIGYSGTDGQAFEVDIQNAEVQVMRLDHPHVVRGAAPPDVIAVFDEALVPR